MNDIPASPFAFADYELNYLIELSRKTTESRALSTLKLQGEKLVKKNLDVFITRGMIAHALTEMAGMTDAQAWEFSNNLDDSIECDYLPIKDMTERYAAVVADCQQFMAMDGDK